ncbi:MAG: hypothetical protein IPO16_00440 [Saprospiraceae bacterium]|nr:hypothetical protein [Saprospiraceae bacterium]
MKKPILFAYPVNDLTIARYLAAKEVDFIGINLDDPDEKAIRSRITQFREWIEGPQLIGVSATPQQATLSDYKLDGFYLDEVFELPSDCIVFRSEQFLIRNPQSQFQYVIIEKSNASFESMQCILKTDINTNPVLDSTIKGFLFAPGNEEKTGLYDFEKLEEWFEKIETIQMPSE